MGFSPTWMSGRTLKSHVRHKKTVFIEWHCPVHWKACCNPGLLSLNANSDYNHCTDQNLPQESVHPCWGPGAEPFSTSKPLLRAWSPLSPYSIDFFLLSSICNFSLFVILHSFINPISHSFIKKKIKIHSSNLSSALLLTYIILYLSCGFCNILVTDVLPSSPDVLIPTLLLVSKGTIRHAD